MALQNRGALLPPQHRGGTSQTLLGTPHPCLSFRLSLVVRGRCEQATHRAMPPGRSTRQGGSFPLGRRGFRGQVACPGWLPFCSAPSPRCLARRGWALALAAALFLRLYLTPLPVGHLAVVQRAAAEETRAP